MKLAKVRLYILDACEINVIVNASVYSCFFLSTMVARLRSRCPDTEVNRLLDQSSA